MGPIRGTLPIAVVTMIVTAGATAGADAPTELGGPTCLGEPATIISDKGVVRGTKEADVIVASRGGLIEARGGGDRICLTASGFGEVYGGSGGDRILTNDGGQNIYPGSGDDRVESGPGRDLITDTELEGKDRYDAGADRDTIRFSIEASRRGPGVGVKVDLALGFSTGRGYDRLIGIDSVVGTFGSDIITGSPGANVLDGVRGGDRIFGAQGEDLIRGATRRFGEGGQSGDPPGDDPFLSGGQGNDRILGREGDDRMAGGEGEDTLLGAAGSDRADGGAGEDVCRGIEDVRGCERD